MIRTECFLPLEHRFLCLPQFEQINPVAGLVMVVAGLIVLTFGYVLLAMPPLVIGLSLIAYYRKDLMQILGL
jgi:hypothetical protein